MGFDVDWGWIWFWAWGWGKTIFIFLLEVGYILSILVADAGFWNKGSYCLLLWGRPKNLIGVGLSIIIYFYWGIAGWFICC